MRLPEAIAVLQLLLSLAAVWAWIYLDVRLFTKARTDAKKNRDAGLYWILTWGYWAIFALFVYNVGWYLAGIINL